MGALRIERRLVDIEQRLRELQQKQRELVRTRRELSPEAFLHGASGIITTQTQIATELLQLRVDPQSARPIEVQEYLDLSLLS